MSEEPPSTAPPAGDEPTRGAKIFGNVVVGLFFVGIAVLVYRGCGGLADVRQVAEDYVEHVRTGRTGEAHALLAAPLRSKLPAAAVLEAIHGPELRRAESVSWNGKAETKAGRGCVQGALDLDGEHHHLDVFLVEEDDAWRIHTVQVYATAVPEQPWSCY